MSLRRLFARAATIHPSDEELQEAQAFLAKTADAAEAAFDAAYPPERLSAERTRILGRLARATGRHEPQIIRFPGSQVPQKGSSGTVHHSRLGGAVAAGLLVGLFLGQQLHLHRESPLPDPLAAGAVPTVARSFPATSEPPSSKSDERFMDELESMLRTPQVDELSVLEAITPRAREVAVNLW